MGMGVGFTDQEEGRIIALVPPKTQTTFRLNDVVLDELQRLSDRLNKPRPDVLELAITHLSGTLRANQPVYIDPPEPPAPAHKRRRRAA